MIMMMLRFFFVIIISVYDELPLWGALMQGEVYRISMQSMWPVVVHLMGIGCLNSKPPETCGYIGERNKNVEKIPNVRRKSISNIDISRNGAIVG